LLRVNEEEEFWEAKTTGITAISKLPSRESTFGEIRLGDI